MSIFFATPNLPGPKQNLKNKIPRGWIKVGKAQSVGRIFDDY